jgi:hypothetical protein
MLDVRAYACFSVGANFSVGVNFALKNWPLTPAVGWTLGEFASGGFAP